MVHRASPRTPLRGRDEDLALIGERLAGVHGGQGATLFVEGRAGFGKTRLLAEAGGMAQRLGVRVGYGAVDAKDRVVPMSALLAALFEGPEPLADAGARRTLPYLPEQRYGLLNELESLLEQIALQSPVLVCIDDMHWGDSGWLTALRTLPAQLADLPIVWLGSFRGGQASPELRAVIERLEEIGAQTLHLKPLGPAEVAQVVSDIVGAEPDPPLLELAQRAHGSPFLLVELLRGLREEGLVRIEAGHASLLEARLPARVRDSMRDRLARLSEPARQAALVASILGRYFSFDELSTMLDQPPSALLGPVDELLRTELLTDDGGRLTFRHDLIREAVRDTLPASAQRALQRQAVDALMAAGAPPVDVAVQLAASAEAGDQITVRTLNQAARTLAPSHPSAAADISRRALELSSANDPLRAALVAETALLLHAAGRVAEGKAFADGVLSEALPPEQEAEVRLCIAGMIALSPDVRVDAGRRALALTGLPQSLRARHLARQVHNLLVAGRPQEAGALLDEARQAASSSSDANATFTLDLAEGLLEYVGGDLRPALERIEAAARSRAKANEPARELVAHVWRTELLAALDRYDESLRLIAENVVSAQRDHQGWALRVWEGCRGRRLLQVGGLADAAAALEGVVVTGEESASVGDLDAAAVVARGRVAIHMGDEPALRSCAAVARALLKTGGPWVRHHAAWLLALEAMAGGNGSAARAHLSSAGENERLTVIPLFPFDVTDEVHLVRIAVAGGDDELVRSAVATAEKRLRLNPGVSSIAGAAAHARGLASSDLGALSEAVEQFEQGPRRVALASALEDAGRLAVEGGEREAGVARLGRALEIYATVGASRDAGRVRKRLRSTGVRRRLVSVSHAEDGWAGLTNSELDVVRLVVQGLTNREAAERLFLSPHTVSTHLRHAFAKLNVNSRVELARLPLPDDIARS